MEVKDGSKTTELRVAIMVFVTSITGLLASAGAISQSESELINAILAASLPVFGVIAGSAGREYIKSRTTVKEAAHKAASTS